MDIALMKESQLKAKKKAYNNQMRKLKNKCFSINNNLQYIRVSNRKLNCLRWHNNETKQPILKKLDICIELKSLSHVFITEAIFTNGSRADIVDLTSSTIYEILCKENEKDFNEKVKKYPSIFRVVKVKV